MFKTVEEQPSFERAMLIDAYGTLLADMGKYEESEKLTEEALKIAESIRGSDDPQVAEIKNNLATSYNYLNKLDEAEKLYKESLKVFRKHFGDYHLRVSSVINNLAFIHIFREDHQKAIPLLLESLNIKLKVLGENHPYLILSYSNVGSTYFNINDFINAEKFMKESVNVGLKNYESDNINLSRSYMWYGRVLDANKNYKESIYYLNKAFLIREKEFGEKNKLTLTAQSLYGQTNLNAGNYIEAERNLVASYNGLKEISGNESEATQKTITSLIELYIKLNRKDKSDFYSKLVSNKNG
jgi:tetratricopeptide (TPR) repeat protein